MLQHSKERIAVKIAEDTGHTPGLGEECHGEEPNKVKYATVKSLIQYTMP